MFIVGFRSDLRIEWSFPLPTHSYPALVRDKWITGEYWRRHDLRRRRRPKGDVRLDKLIERIGDVAQPLLPWRTVRDSISDLPKLRVRQTADNDDCHFLNPGARVYHGHTGSPLDDPAKTLKAGSHGVPGGENTLVRDGVLGARYFSVRECARLQTFPDDYTFCGAWTSTIS